MDPISKLIRELGHLPGVGEKTATRLAYHLLRCNKDEALALAAAIKVAKEKISFCQQCFDLAEDGNCRICSNDRRDKSVVCVVEEPQDVQAIEKTGAFSGTYHILHGSISPLDGVGPDELRLQELFKRIKDNKIAELIIATNPTTTGEATALYIAKLLKPLNVKMTRIAFGIPFGGDIEYVDRSTLARSIEFRSAL